MIKKKSLIVAAVSGFIICCVLVLTLVGYIAYLELKDSDLKNIYNVTLDKINARIYSRHLDVSDLGVYIEAYGPLKGKPVLSGSVKNIGYRDVSDVLLRVKLTDNDGAVLYEVVFHPQEPSLGYSGLSHISIPYLSGAQRPAIKRGASLQFKKVILNCPDGILSELNRISLNPQSREKWNGRIAPEILSVSF